MNEDFYQRMEKYNQYQYGVKPCPFCGMKPVHINRIRPGGGGYIHSIECYCGMVGLPNAIKFGCGDSSDRAAVNAIKSWNTRA